MQNNHTNRTQFNIIYQKILKKTLSERKSFRGFKKREPTLSTEQKIESFILRNSKNGYFTKVSTIPYKFEISESRAWDIVGEFLSNGSLESIHDENTGDMKLCESGKTYSVMDLEKKRNREKYSKNKNNTNQKNTKQKKEKIKK